MQPERRAVLEAVADAVTEAPVVVGFQVVAVLPITLKAAAAAAHSTEESINPTFPEPLPVMVEF